MHGFAQKVALISGTSTSDGKQVSDSQVQQHTVHNYGDAVAFADVREVQQLRQPSSAAADAIQSGAALSYACFSYWHLAIDAVDCISSKVWSCSLCNPPQQPLPAGGACCSSVFSCGPCGRDADGQYVLGCQVLMFPA
jgi:hypothetical protein